MENKETLVKNYFNNTNKYISDNHIIELRRTYIAENLSGTSGKNIIDIGCGNGQISLPFINNNKVTFLDLSENMLEIIKNQIPEELISNANIINCDFNTFPTEQKYDIIICLGVLAHVENIEKGITKLKNLMGPNGTMIIQFTNNGNVLSKLLRFTTLLKKLLGIKYGYEINYFNERYINCILKELNLSCKRRVTYWPTFPCYSFLPKGFMKYLYFRIINNPRLSRWGSEIILFLKIQV